MALRHDSSGTSQLDVAPAIGSLRDKKSDDEFDMGDAVADLAMPLWGMQGMW